MPAQTIAQGLAYINWTLLLGLALGSFGLVAVMRLATDATRGYLAFTASSAVQLGLLTVVADTGLPEPAGLAIVPAPHLDGLRRLALSAFVALAMAYVVAIRRERRSPALAAAALLAGALAAGIAAYGWSGGTTAAVPVLVQLLALAAATGGALGALVLGHWYLVTPRLSERPLVLASRALTVVVAIQCLLFLAWMATGTGGDGRPFAALTGTAALFVWLRLVVGLAFPLVLSWMALATARTRSMESATGLLYIDLAAIAGGTIVAAGLYFAFGLLV